MFSNKLCVDQVCVKDKRVLIRVDFNVPIDDKLRVKDTKRIVAAIPTIKYCLDQGARSIVLISHLGRPNGFVNHRFSLKPLVPILQSLLKKPITFLSDCVGPETINICRAASDGEIFLLENVRFHIEEEGKAKDPSGMKILAKPESITMFRESLSKLGDIFVCDAFGTSHRAHSSIVGISIPIRCAGFLMKTELEAFSKALDRPQRPFLAVLGGAKVEDKIKLIDNLLDKVDELIISGGMAFTFKKVLHKVEIGKSLFDVKGAQMVEQIMAKAEARGVKVHLPVDYVVGDKFDKHAIVNKCTDKTGIPPNCIGMDHGPRSAEMFMKRIFQAKTIVMNGPCGVFEFPAFSTGTQRILECIAAATHLNGAISVLGGGDSASAAKLFNMDKYFTHVSTGGGATLELLEGKPMPGITALSNGNKSKL